MTRCGRTLAPVTELDIRVENFDSEVARHLVTAALADLAGRYGGSGDDTPLEATQFDPPAGAFLVGYLGDEPVGCGGWRSHGDTGETAELKRMYTTPAARGRGIARRMLAAVEESARAHGRRLLVLECGDKQPEAIALYSSAGYERIPNFGYYRDAEGCISFSRTL